MSFRQPLKYVNFLKEATNVLNVNAINHYSLHVPCPEILSPNSNYTCPTSILVLAINQTSAKNW